MTANTIHTTGCDISPPCRFDMRQGSPLYSVNSGEKQQEKTKEEDEEPIRCLFCQHPVTEPNFACTQNGHHTHACTNPAGISFHIGIFRQAPGCRVLGPATEEHTWFKGYAWQLALCGNCQAHLGWRFISPGKDPFFGLILRNLSTP